MEKVSIEDLYSPWHGCTSISISTKGRKESMSIVDDNLSSSPRWWCERWEEPHVGTWERALGADTHRLQPRVGGRVGRKARQAVGEKLGRVSAARLALHRAERSRAFVIEPQECSPRMPGWSAPVATQRRWWRNSSNKKSDITIAATASRLWEGSSVAKLVRELG